MKPGRLREVITLQRRVDDHDDMGQRITTWQDYATVFCQINYDMGTEAPKNRTEGEFERPAGFIIRHRSDVNSADRIVYKKQIFIIEGMKPLSVTRYYDALELRGVHRG
jgi:SPP1 family predicted phage head-tail adaptor